MKKNIMRHKIKRMAKKWKHKIKNKKKLLLFTKFLIKLNLFAIPLYLIILLSFQWPFLMSLTTDFSFGFMKLTGLNVEKRNDLIITPVENGDFAAYVSWDSTGWKSMFALFALIFATSFPLRKKLLGLFFIPLIYLVNIIRIWFMFFFVSNYGLKYYDFVHATVWSWGLIFTILVFWLIWMKKF